MKIEISIVIPCFCVGANIVADIIPKLKVLDAIGCKYELIIVLDGPDPAAEKALTRFVPGHPQISVLKLAKNRGKGFAVRSGMAAAQGEYIGYMDADNDIDPKILADMHKVIAGGAFDAILPSKRHPDSVVKYPGERKLFSRLYNLYVRNFLGIKYSDTQLGAKLYRAELVKQVVPNCKINRFIFELEMLTRAKEAGFQRFQEIPVVLELSTPSTIGISNSLSIFMETLQFSWDFKTGKFKTRHT